MLPCHSAGRPLPYGLLLADFLDRRRHRDRNFLRHFCRIEVVLVPLESVAVRKGGDDRGYGMSGCRPRGIRFTKTEARR
jgi:hypothetical protein